MAEAPGYPPPLAGEGWGGGGPIEAAIVGREMVHRQTFRRERVRVGLAPVSECTKAQGTNVARARPAAAGLGVCQNRAVAERTFQLRRVRRSPCREGMTVRLDRGSLRRPLVALADDEAEARDLFAGLTLDVGQTTGETCARPRYFDAFPGAWLAIFVVPLLSGGLFLLAGRHQWKIAMLAPFAIVAPLSVLLAPTRVCVGADGIALVWLWYRRYLRYANVASVTVAPHGWCTSARVLLALASGETLTITSDHHPEELATRIRAEMEQSSSLAAPARASLLDYRGGSAGAWIEQLREVRELATHRRAPLHRDELWQLAAEPSVRADRRAAAAVALSPLAESEREPLCAIARAVAEPRLRRLLDAVAANEPEARSTSALAAFVPR